METQLLVLGAIAAIIGIGYFARDLIKWVWRHRHIVSKLLWTRSGFKRTIQKTKSLKVAVAHYPPLAFVSRRLDGSGFEASGPAFELVKLFALQHEIEIEVIPLQWHFLREHFSRDGCNVLCPIFPTEERNQFGRVVAVTHTIGLGAVSMINNDKVVNAASLRDPDVRVAVTEGEVGWEFIRDKHPEKYQSVETLVSKSNDITDTMVAVIQGTADVALADALSCFRFLQEHDPEGTRLHNPFLGQPLSSFECGLMVPKKEIAFGDWLESEMAQIRVTKEFLEYEAKELHGWSNFVTREVPEGITLPKVG